MSTNDAGGYSLVVTNSYGRVTSAVANLTVLVPGTPLAVVQSGSSLNVSWPADQTGWRLEYQADQLSGGLGTNWVTWPGSSQVTSASVPISSTNSALFFRLVFP